MNTDIALVCLKSYQTANAVDNLAQILHQNGLAISLQNGHGNGQILQRQLGANRVTRAITTQGATVIKPGFIQHAGGTETWFEINTAKIAKLEYIVKILNECSLPAQIKPDFNRLYWQKLLINACINPLTALLRMRNGELLDYPACKIIFERIIHESIGIAAAAGFMFDKKDILDQVITVCSNTANNNSSMLQDIFNKRPTEIEAINGALIKTASKFGVQAPMNTQLYKLICKQEIQSISIEELMTKLQFDDR